MASRTEEGDQSRPSESNYRNLALLFQDVFTRAVRIQASRPGADPKGRLSTAPIGDVGSYRQKTIALLDRAAAAARQLGYTGGYADEARFAVVSLFDEVVHHSDDPSRSRWAARSLADELFSESLAGEVFFDRLDALRKRRDSAELADVLEVYHLCLLLGFRGKYPSSEAADLARIRDELRHRIDHVRGNQAALAPEGCIPGNDDAGPRADSLTSRMRYAAYSCAAGTTLVFILGWLRLGWRSDSVRHLVETVIGSQQ